MYSGVIRRIVVAASRGRPLIAAQMVVAVTVGFIAATYCNYFIGHFGLYRALRRAGLTTTLERARLLFDRYGAAILLAGFVHPAASSLLSVSAGIAGMRLARFSAVAVVAITCWNAVLGGIAYSVGSGVQMAVSNPWLMSWFLALWSLTAFVLGFWRAARRAVLSPAKKHG